MRRVYGSGNSTTLVFDVHFLLYCSLSKFKTFCSWKCSVWMYQIEERHSNIDMFANSQHCKYHLSDGAELSHFAAMAANMWLSVTACFVGKDGWIDKSSPTVIFQKCSTNYCWTRCYALDDIVLQSHLSPSLPCFRRENLVNSLGRCVRDVLYVYRANRPYKNWL